MADPRSLLLTRPQAQSEAFAAALAERLPGRFRPMIAPLITITPLLCDIDLAGVQGLIFTSANGVDSFASRIADRSLPAWCVGEMTAAAARHVGLAARSADGSVADLAALVAAAHRPDAGPFLHLRGRHSVGGLVARLAEIGVPARAAEFYDQAPTPLTMEARDLLARRRIDVLTFFSPRTARLFAAEAAEARWDLSAATAISLSAAADACLGPLPLVRGIAEGPTRDGMLDALAAL